MSQSANTTIMSIWLSRGWIACLLWPLSLLFFLVVAIRRFAYKNRWLSSVRLPVPVVVVGNIFVGGTGKTPVVIWLFNVLKKAGFTPGIISRGYGAHAKNPLIVKENSPVEQVGDEPLLISQKTQAPLVVCHSRVAAGLALLEAFPQVDIIISDDGMQHYALERDIEIMLFDNRGGGNQWMLPAGPLREPVSRHGDFTIINGHNYPSPGNPIYKNPIFKMELINVYAYQLVNPQNKCLLTQIKSKALLAAAGIGHPERFFASLRKAGLTFDTLSLADHYDFKKNPFESLQVDTILLTEKDAVKCASSPMLSKDERLWVVPAEAKMDSNELEKNIVERCRGCQLDRRISLPNL